MTCIWLAGIFSQFHRQKGGGMIQMFKHTNVYMPPSLQLFYQTWFFSRSTPRYQKTFEKMGLRDLHFACVDFGQFYRLGEGGG